MPPPPAAGPAVPATAPNPAAEAPMAEPKPVEARETIKAQLRQAYSELKALAASAGIEWAEIEVQGATPASAGPVSGPPPMMKQRPGV